jgi:hypothetical protein
MKSAMLMSLAAKKKQIKKKQRTTPADAAAPNITPPQNRARKP